MAAMKALRTEPLGQRGGCGGWRHTGGCRSGRGADATFGDARDGAPPGHPDVSLTSP
ncbi:MAG: hypothetical protein LBT40_05190 [Deltaproteobacteria bacterium]|nr:hypothetical protein [Deltaproteobacteria bacterium]